MILIRMDELEFLLISLMMHLYPHVKYLIKVTEKSHIRISGNALLKNFGCLELKKMWGLQLFFLSPLLSIFFFYWKKFNFVVAWQNELLNSRRDSKVSLLILAIQEKQGLDSFWFFSWCVLDTGIWSITASMSSMPITHCIPSGMRSGKSCSEFWNVWRLIFCLLSFLVSFIVIWTFVCYGFHWI